MEKRLISLVGKYPGIFSDSFYFECQEGWYELLDTLCDHLQARTDRHGDPQVIAQQVKEKYGTLRFYVGVASDEQFALIDQTEEKSARICDVCGAPGVLRDGGWMMTRCDQHLAYVHTFSSVK